MRIRKIWLGVLAAAMLLSACDNGTGNSTGESVMESTATDETLESAEGSREVQKEESGESTSDESAGASDSQETEETEATQTNTSAENQDYPKAEYTIEGTVFKYNGKEYKLEDYCAVANAFMGEQQLGQYLVLESHINPNNSCYLFFDLEEEQVVKLIFGSALVFRDQDITSAVYSFYSEVYDFYGTKIAQVNDIEITDLAYSADGKQLEISGWYITDGEEEREKTIMVDLPDRELYRSVMNDYHEIIKLYSRVQKGEIEPVTLQDKAIFSTLPKIGWPSDSIDKDAAGYALYDIDGNGIPELLIGLDGKIRDIFTVRDGKVSFAFTSSDSGWVSLYADNSLCVDYLSEEEKETVWKVLDGKIGYFFSMVERIETPTENGNVVSYYEYCPAESLEEIEKIYSETGSIPVWAWEWNGELTQEEYENRTKHDELINLEFTPFDLAGKFL